MRRTGSIATVEITPEGSGTRLRFTEQAVFLDGYDDAGSRERGTGGLLDALDKTLPQATVQAGAGALAALRDPSECRIRLRPFDFQQSAGRRGPQPGPSRSRPNLFKEIRLCDSW